jgi:hypothetical protein
VDLFEINKKNTFPAGSFVINSGEKIPDGPV